VKVHVKEHIKSRVNAVVEGACERGNDVHVQMSASACEKSA
jgi:hypothetical protein